MALLKQDFLNSTDPHHCAAMLLHTHTHTHTHTYAYLQLCEVNVF